MYSVSTMEAAIRPLGIVSNSSCSLLSFLDWVFSHRRVMDYRFGRIRTVRYCYRRYRVSRSQHRVRDSSVGPPLRRYGFLHVGLLNERRIENWLEIETTATSTRGTVAFSPTNEALVRGAAVNPNMPVLVGDPGQSMTDLATLIEARVQLAPDRPVGFSSNVFIQSTTDKTIPQFHTYELYNMIVSSSRRVVDPLGSRLYGDAAKWNLDQTFILTDEDIRHEI
ncbi:hypothetical protein BS47DRAFT_791368 [Hydnum rufescens UP504]|uniref:Uncharacterized protein n=1 Tax=Hydnum rufescens UP504 TaxID=1448309 RepID=A0A9P6DY51_9AGAM|nr:hypothetical protein BS47DRAFT_791368 [Hydnum rufescens UP504]